MDLREINRQIDIDHWYYQTKFLAVKKLLTDIGVWPPAIVKESVIIEIGAGSGIFIEAFFNSLKVAPKAAYAVDIFYPQDLLGLHKGIHFVRDLPGQIRPSYLFFIDIMEHLNNDIEFLKRWVKIAQTNSYFIFTVPAFQFLWSNHDFFLGHKRRYALKDIERTVSSCGLKLIRSSYFFAVILPFVFLLRKIFEPLYKYLKIYCYQGIRPINPVLNSFLKYILTIEIKLGTYNHIFGLSCIVVAVKQKETV